MNILAGDIGGTNARLALFTTDGLGPLRIARERTYPSSKYPGLGEIVLEFVRDDKTEVAAACFAVAGPVVGGDIKASNLPWLIHGKALATQIGVKRTALINDFDAVGYGVTQLGAGDVETLQTGNSVKDGPIALLGAGTGLGQGLVLRMDGRTSIVPSEGGHVTFAARNEVEWGLARYLSAKYGGHISYERVLSGPGLVATYHYVVESGLAPAAPSVTDEMLQTDPAAVISAHAMADSDHACSVALALFTSIYGSQAGNVAMATLSTGGVYLAGGIAKRIIPLLRSGDFLKSFADKGRMGALLASIPVHVITNGMVGLLGAAAHAADRATAA
jgi:glucokinase